MRNSRPRLTIPGVTDIEYMSVVCEGDRTTVDFHETEEEACAAARAALNPGSSVYVGRIGWQGENTLPKTRGHGASARSAIYCGHANECPRGRCDCPANCYCRSHTCRSL